MVNQILRYSIEDIRKALSRLGIDTEIEYYDIKQEESGYDLLFEGVIPREFTPGI